MMWLIWAIVAWTILFSYALTSVARRIALRTDFVDRPDGKRKQHQLPTPLLGGGAIGAAVLGGWFLPAALGWEPQQSSELPSFSPWTLAISACLFCLLGLLDDRWGIRPRTKFLLQIVACLPFVLWGDTVKSVEVLGTQIHFGGWGIVFTIFWLVACANVINLIDGLDGLAGSVGLVIVLTIAVLCGLSGRVEVAIAALVVAGSLIGFLFHNWPPAKIFMGDAGSLMIGFLIGALSIEASLKQATGFALVAPTVMISIPVFDTVMAILRRKLSGKSIGQADRGHIHHRLVEAGLSRVQALLALTALSIIPAAAAIGSAHFQMDGVAVFVCFLVLGSLVLGRIFGHLESLLFFGHLRELLRLAIDTHRSLASRMLMARLPHLMQSSPQDGWAQVCSLAARHEVHRLDFACVQPRTDETLARRAWTSASQAMDSDNVWEFQVTVQRNQDTVATLRVVGETSGRETARCGDDLLQLADRFCRLWPVEESDERSATIAFPRIFDEQDVGETDTNGKAKENFRHAA